MGLLLGGMGQGEAAGLGAAVAAAAGLGAWHGAAAAGTAVAGAADQGPQRSRTRAEQARRQWGGVWGELPEPGPRRAEGTHCSCN